MQQKYDTPNPFGNAPQPPPPPSLSLSFSLSGADREHLMEPDGTQNQPPLLFVLCATKQALLKESLLKDSS